MHLLENPNSTILQVSNINSEIRNEFMNFCSDSKTIPSFDNYCFEKQLHIMALQWIVDKDIQMQHHIYMPRLYVSCISHILYGALSLRTTGYMKKVVYYDPRTSIRTNVTVVGKTFSERLESYRKIENVLQYTGYKFYIPEPEFNCVNSKIQSLIENDSTNMSFGYSQDYDLGFDRPIDILCRHIHELENGLDPTAIFINGIELNFETWKLFCNRYNEDLTGFVL